MVINGSKDDLAITARSGTAFGHIFKFHEVLREEINSVNKRRNHTKIRLEEESTDNEGNPVLRPKKQSTIVGLALSGGGIRSAAFCLGALQALDLTRVFNHIDYLSTVSGGGYIGSSLTAGMGAYEGRFPFEAGLAQDETPSIQHIRDNSNYLFPNGPGDFLRNAAIYARGLIANIVIIFPFLLVPAAFTILAYPRVETLDFPVNHFFGVLHIRVGLTVALLAILCLWAFYRAAVLARHPGETHNIAWIGYIAIALSIASFIEIQPLILKGMFDPTTSMWTEWGGFIGHAATWLAPFAAAIGFFSQKMGQLIENATASPLWHQRLMGWLGKASIWIASAAVPLILWAVYLKLSYWGIQEYSGVYEAPQWLQQTAQWLQQAAQWLRQGAIFFFHKIGNPQWLQQAAIFFFLKTGNPIASLYLGVAIVLAIASLGLRANANSLNPLYRDRLSKAFLFTPAPSSPKKDHDLEENYIKLSKLSEKLAPYHVINSALNIQDSRVSNRRGRNADFFMFSRNFVGSHATGYVRTTDIEEIAPTLDLAAAMAASGAAFSPEMGTETIKTLTPTLALLNLRLGYWLRNPRKVAKAARSFFPTHNPWANYYFLLEASGLLSESRKSVYLSDGGHLENLGIYELLRRRCGVIIAVDAEADAQMNFSSFVKLQRYARIDLGIRIGLPWEKIRELTLKVGNEINEKEYNPRVGPHCAIGEIQYPKNRLGILIYIKSSLTGDENDYILDYRQRYPTFPHETTLDQMFTEEQFEVYRALGFHATFGLFDRQNEFTFLDAKAYPHMPEHLNRLDRLFPHISNPADQAPDRRRTFYEWFSAAAEPAG